MNRETIYKNSTSRYQYKHGFQLDEDFLFACEVYPANDFRYQFVNQYKETVSEILDKKVYNCRIEEDINLPHLLDIFIYCEDCNDDILYGDVEKQKEDPCIAAFFELLELNPLPELGGYRFRFYFLNFFSRKMAYYIQPVYSQISQMLKVKYNEIDETDFWNEKLYIFIHDGINIEKLKKQGILESIRKDVFQHIKQNNQVFILEYDEFHIYADYTGIKKQLGREYFNSEAMNQCEVI